MSSRGRSSTPNLDEIAEQELLNEAKRGAARASIYGALGWQKCPLKPTNKVFLQNMLLNTISANNQKEQNSMSKRDSMKRKMDDKHVKLKGSDLKHSDVNKKKFHSSDVKSNCQKLGVSKVIAKNHKNKGVNNEVACYSSSVNEHAKPSRKQSHKQSDKMK